MTGLPVFSQDSVTTDSTGRKLGALAGVVLDSAKGSPLQGALVRLTSSVAVNPRFAYTNERGGFVIGKLEPGRYDVLVRHIGFLPFVGRRDVMEGAVDTLVVKIPESTAILSSTSSGIRPAWDIGPQDTTTFEGNLHYSWEGDSFITCGGKLFSAKLQPGLLAEVWKGLKPAEGDSRYLRVQARFDDDPSTRDLAGGPPLYIWRIIENRKQAPADCAH